MRNYYLGVVILESLNDPGIMDERVTVLQESDVIAPLGDPYPVWSRRLVDRFVSKDVIKACLP